MNDMRRLIDVGKEEGYSTDHELNNPSTPGVRSAQDIDDLLAAIRTRGLDVVDGESQQPYPALEQRLAGEPDEIDLNAVPVALEAANDPVRVYLREMGASPLLTREGEVEIAKRIERGQLSALKALSRSPIAIRQVLGIGQELKRGLRSIKETVVFDEEEITEEILQDRVKEITRRIDQVQKHYNTARRLAERLVTNPADKKGRRCLRCRSQLSREIVRMSLIIRNLDFTSPERKRLTERVNKTMELMRSLDRQLSNLEKKIASTRSQELKKNYRTMQRQHHAHMKRLESEAGITF